MKNGSFAYRIERNLMMVYETQNYWGSGFCPLSGILKKEKKNVSETGSNCILR
jgi:hypothetical protein